MKIALVGNQNSGKSSLFNLLCGAKQKIGNWPGVTIEEKKGVIKNTSHDLIDLPGIYSLNTFTKEEEITSNYLKNTKLDLIINVVDVTTFERSMYLTTQLKELKIPMILVLNMCDLLEKENLLINCDLLENILGVKVLKVSSKTKIGLSNLLKEIEKKEFINREIKIVDSTDLETKIIQRYNFIENLSKKVLKRQNNSVENKLDKILLNKYFGLPIFFLIMALIYFLSTGPVGSTISSYMELIINKFDFLIRNLLISFHASNWIISLTCEGIIAGVGAVVSFLPQLFILFLCINFLENSGYMNRITMLLDRFFHWLGLSGKSLIPFIVGSGCSVPAMMATRTIENEKEREKTLALTSFIPCSAKLPLVVLVSSFFFKKYRSLIAISLYFLAILVIIFLALFLKKKKKNVSYFISELPRYQIPSLSVILKDTLSKCIDFVKRAGSVILFSSIIIWCLSHLSPAFEFENDIKNSLLAHIGKTISFVFVPILKVNSWEASISALQGIIAKEQVVASMEILSEGQENIFLSSAFNFFTPLTAYSFCVFNLFSSPCINAIATLKQELKSRKKAIKIVFLQTIFAYILAVFISNIGGLFL